MFFFLPCLLACFLNCLIPSILITVLSSFISSSFSSFLRFFFYFPSSLSSLPLSFLASSLPSLPHSFHSQNLPFPFTLLCSSDQILEAMDYAVYRDDVKHIILDNLQVCIRSIWSDVIWHRVMKAVFLNHINYFSIIIPTHSLPLSLSRSLSLLISLYFFLSPSIYLSIYLPPCLSLFLTL